MLRMLLMVVAWLAAHAACAHHTDAPAQALDYVPPAAGTYRLQRIMPAPDGSVLDVNGRVQKLSRYTRAKVSLVGFIYTTCTDPDGCPLAYQVFDALSTKIQADRRLHDQVRLVTLSFDPARDTPSVMARYAGSRVKAVPGLQWYFLTPRSVHALMPLVEGFGQDVRYSVNASNGKPVRELSHVLKVFLIDRVGDIREIYSSDFLHPQTVMNDIKTLLMEEGVRFD